MAIRSFEKEIKTSLKNIADVGKKTAEELDLMKKAASGTFDNLKDSNSGTAEGKKQIESLAKVVKSLTAKIKVLEKTIKGNNSAQNLLKGSTAALKQEIKELDKEYKETVTSQNINSASSQKLAKKLSDLKQKTFDLNRASSRLNKTFKSSKGSVNRLEAENRKILETLKKMPIEFQKTDKAAIKLKETFNRNDAALKKFDASIGRNFRHVGNYSNALSNLPGPLGNVISQTKSFTSSLGGTSAGLSGATLATGGALIAVTALAAGIKKAFDVNLALSDSLSDVQKTTGFTKDEVDLLAISLKKVDTRESLAGLLSIAEEGGRLGIAKENILAFTKAANVAGVALGDDFSGGAAEVSKNLGKLTGLFKETRDLSIEKAFAKAGSAINELSANTKGTAENITEFALRIGQLPESLRPTIQDALALGAALEEVGIDAEEGSRPLSIFLTKAATNIKGFAKQMGISAKEAEKLINTDVTEFTKQFAKSLDGLSGTQAAAVLSDLKLSASGVQKVLGALSSRTERLAEIQGTSNKATKDAISLQEEYNIKNENLAASVDKLGNAFDNAFVSSGISDVFKSIIDALTDILNFLGDDDVGFFEKWLSIISPLTGIINFFRHESKEAAKAVTEMEKADIQAAKAARIHALAVQALNGDVDDFIAKLKAQEDKDFNFLPGFDSGISDIPEVLAEIERIRKNKPVVVKIKTEGEDEVKRVIDIIEKIDLSQTNKLQKAFEELNELTKDIRDSLVGVTFENLNTELTGIDDVLDRIDQKEEELQRKREERADRRKQIEGEFLDFAIASAELILQSTVGNFDAEFEALATKQDRELAHLEGNEVAQQAVRERYGREEKALRQKEARAQILTQIPINAVRALATEPAPNFVAAGLATAFGLLQLALLPKFFTGVENLSMDTMAWVGEKGRELKISKNNEMSLTPSKPTLMNLSKGDTILPHEKTESVLKGMKENLFAPTIGTPTMRASVNRITSPVKEKNNNEVEVLRKLTELTNVVKNKPLVWVDQNNNTHYLIDKKEVIKKGHVKENLSERYA